MSFREAVRNWANKPSRREIAEKKAKSNEQIAKANEESAQVRMLKKQIKVLEELLETAYNQIKSQSELIANHKEGDWMDKLVDKGLDVVDSLFGKPKNSTMKYVTQSTPVQTPVEATETTNTATSEEVPVSTGYSSEQIAELVNSFDIEDIKKGAKAPYFMFSKSLLKHYPEASQENILEAYTLVQEVAENGKSR
jgi:hypothetical protein